MEIIKMESERIFLNLTSPHLAKPSFGNDSPSELWMDFTENRICYVKKGAEHHGDKKKLKFTHRKIP